MFAICSFVEKLFLLISSFNISFICEHFDHIFRYISSDLANFPCIFRKCYFLKLKFKPEIEFHSFGAILGNGRAEQTVPVFSIDNSGASVSTTAFGLFCIHAAHRARVIRLTLSVIRPNLQLVSGHSSCLFVLCVTHLLVIITSPPRSRWSTYPRPSVPTVPANAASTRPTRSRSTRRAKIPPRLKANVVTIANNADMGDRPSPSSARRPRPPKRSS